MSDNQAESTDLGRHFERLIERARVDRRVRLSEPLAEAERLAKALNTPPDDPPKKERAG